MDQDGLFLMLKMCAVCSTNKGSWKKCMGRRHNPRMSTVPKERLTFAHRQCVKPDQAMTIYKLRDHQTNEEFLEFDEDVIFQTPCSACLNIKCCLQAGHQLVDWRPKLTDVRDGRSSSGGAASPSPSSAPPLSSPSTRAGSGKKGNTNVPPLKAAATGRKTEGAASTTPKGRARGKSTRASAAEQDVDPGGAGCEKVSAAGSSRRRADTEAQNAKPTPKSSHKRKSQGPVSTPPAKSSKTTTPRSTGSSQVAKSSGSKDKPVSKRGGRERHSAPGGGTFIGRRKSSDSCFTPKSETDGESSETPTAEGGGADSKSKAATNDDSDTSASPRNVPVTVAEKLDMVKGEEAALLREFEDTHKMFAEVEGAKLAEMDAFRRAGEAALQAMREKKEESLRRISEARMHKAKERVRLVQQRLEEFEAAEAASRAEARERDARLEAEQERLALGASSTGGKGASGSWEDGSWISCAHGDGTAPAAGADITVLRAPETAQAAAAAATEADSRDASCDSSSSTKATERGQSGNEPVSFSSLTILMSPKTEALPSPPSSSPPTSAAAAPAGEPLPSASSTSASSALVKEDEGSSPREKQGSAVADDAAAAAAAAVALAPAPPTGVAGEDGGNLSPGGRGSTAVENAETTKPAGRVNGVVPAVAQPNSGCSVAAR